MVLNMKNISELSEVQEPFFKSLLDSIFDKLLKDIESRPDRIFNSPRVRNEKCKDYFAIGFFGMAIL